MKVLKKGMLPEDRTYQTTCTRCDTIMEFKRHEGKLISNQFDSIIEVTCPVCLHNVCVNSEHYLENENRNNQYGR